MKQFMDILLEYESANRAGASMMIRFLLSELGKKQFQEDIQNRIAPAIKKIFDVIEEGTRKEEDGTITVSFMLAILGLTTGAVCEQFQRKIDSLRVDGINRK